MENGLFECFHQRDVEPVSYHPKQTGPQEDTSIPRVTKTTLYVHITLDEYGWYKKAYRIYRSSRTEKKNILVMVYFELRHAPWSHWSSLCIFPDTHYWENEYFHACRSNYRSFCICNLHIMSICAQLQPTVSHRHGTHFAQLPSEGWIKHWLRHWSISKSLIMHSSVFDCFQHIEFNHDYSSVPPKKEKL